MAFSSRADKGYSTFFVVFSMQFNLERITTFSFWLKFPVMSGAVMIAPFEVLFSLSSLVDRSCSLGFIVSGEFVSSSVESLDFLFDRLLPMNNLRDLAIY